MSKVFINPFPTESFLAFIPKSPLSKATDIIESCLNNKTLCQEKPLKVIYFSVEGNKTICYNHMLIDEHDFYLLNFNSNDAKLIHQAQKNYNYAGKHGIF